MLLTELYDIETEREASNDQIVHTFNAPDDGRQGKILMSVQPIDGMSEDENASSLAWDMLEGWVEMKGYGKLSESKIKDMFGKLGTLTYMSVDISIGEPKRKGRSEAKTLSNIVADVVNREITENSPDLIFFEAEDDTQIRLYDVVSKSINGEYKTYRYQKGTFMMFKPVVATSIKSMVSSAAGSDSEVKDNVKEKSAAVRDEFDKAIKSLIKSPDAQAYDDEQIVDTLMTFEIDDIDALKEYLKSTGKNLPLWLRGRVAKLRN